MNLTELKALAEAAENGTIEMNEKNYLRIRELMMPANVLKLIEAIEVMKQALKEVYENDCTNCISDINAKESLAKVEEILK